MNTQPFAADVQASMSGNQIPAIVPAAGRAMISAIFILSGLSKIAAPAMTIGYIQSVGLPLPTIAFALSAFVEIVVLALFSLATAMIFHSALSDQNQFIHFFKNIAMAGGLLHVIAFGGGRISIDARGNRR
jgi:putative oxidoreductase